MSARPMSGSSRCRSSCARRWTGREAALRDDAYGEVVRLVDELAADTQALRGFVDEHVGDIARLPADLADAALAALPAAALRQALVDAEASVLALLGETGATRADP